jgi:hypothetical protein
MTRPPLKAKRDANEPEIVSELRAYGLSVYKMDKPLDLLCGYRGQTYLVEVKTPKGTFTAPQEAFLETWKGDCTILRSIEEAAEFARNVRAG